MKMRASAIVAAVALSVGCHAPALASKADFELCDGLKAPKKDSDGMRPSANRSFGFSSFPLSAAARINACTNALADPLLLPAHVARKSNLLLARAMGQIDNGSPDLAIADLELAQTSSADFLADPRFARTMGVSLKLVRALALIRKGDLANAQDAVNAAAELRPFSASTQQIASVLRKRTMIGSDVSPYEKVLPLYPAALDQHFAWLVESGRHNEALLLFPTLKLDFPAAPVAYPINYGISGPGSEVIASTVTSMLAAYAMAASGKGADAQALVEKTRSQLTTALTMPQPANGVAAKNTLLEPLTTYISHWEFLINSRQRVARGETMEVVKDMVGRDLPDSLVVVDLLKAMRNALPAAQKSFAPDPDKLKARLIENASKEDLAVSLIEKSLPPLELSNRTPAYKKSTKSIIDILGPVGYQRDGFRSTENASTGIITVEFLGTLASAPTVDEMTMLHAADITMQHGKDGFIIVDRRDFSRTMTTTMGYARTPISSSPAGYKTELDIKLVDLAASRTDAGVNPARVLDAKAVYWALAPIYAQAKEPGQEK